MGEAQQGGNGTTRSDIGRITGASWLCGGVSGQSVDAARPNPRLLGVELASSVERCTSDLKRYRIRERVDQVALKSAQ